MIEDQFRKVLVTSARSVLTPEFAALGFRSSSRPPAWTREHLRVSLVHDSKSVDSYSGGAFTLEFELSRNGRFGRKVSGRVVAEQLFDRDQRAAVLSLRNTLATRISPPDERVLQVPDVLRERYLRRFQVVQELAWQFDMRFRDDHECRTWMKLLAEMLPTLVRQGDKISPRTIYAIDQRVV